MEQHVLAGRCGERALADETGTQRCARKPLHTLSPFLMPTGECQGENGPSLPPGSISGERVVGLRGPAWWYPAPANRVLMKPQLDLLRERLVAGRHSESGDAS